MLIPNKCFSCNLPIQEDSILKARYVCSNQRCIRFGLLSAIYLAPSSNTPDPITPNEEGILKDKKEALTEITRELENNAQEPKSDDKQNPQPGAQS